MFKDNLLIELSGENYELAEAEANAISDVCAASKAERLEEDLIRLECPRKNVNTYHERMGLAHRVLKETISGALDEMDEMLLNASKSLRQYVVGKRYAVITHKLHKCPSGMDITHLRSHMGTLLDVGKVDLTKPETIIEIWVGAKAYIGLRVGEVGRQRTEERKVDRRPFFSPISIHPKMARAMVNLARLSIGETLYDPFCGTGGILIEAGMMGVLPTGSDVRADMVDGTKQNMSHFGLEGWVFVHDVNEVLRDIRVDGIVTDPPYGRSTKMVGGEVSGLVKSCFQRARELLPKGKYMVLVLPHDTEIPEKESDIALRERYELKVHGSLTRVFCVYQKT